MANGLALLVTCFQARRWALIVSVLLISVHGVALCLQNISPKWLFTHVLQPEGLSGRERLVRLLWFALIYLATALVFRMAAWHFSYRLAIKFREHVLAQLRMRLVRAAARGCAQFHQRHPAGQLHGYIVGSPIQNISQFLQHFTMALPAGLVNVALTFFFFWSWDWLTAVAMMGCSTLSVASTVYFSRGLSAGDVQHQARESEVSASIGDFLRGARILPFQPGGTRYAEGVCAQIQEIGRGASQRELAGHTEYMRHESLGYAFYLVLLVACTVRYLSHDIDLAVVAACLTAYAGLTWPMYSVISSAILWPKASAALQGITGILAHASSVPEAPAGLRQFPSRVLDLRLVRASFTYPGAARRTLHDVTLEIPFGQRIGIMGRSGSGKSTLAALMLRAYDPEVGRVTLGGADLRRVPLAELQAKVGVVAQDSYFFRGSLRANLCLGKVDATDAELAAACAAAGASPVIARLPAGFDALLDEGSLGISGGERQRLAIARALLADPDILILDEATSALDAATESVVLENLFRASRRRTIVCITHRISTAAHCDRIIIVENGAIRQEHAVTPDPSVPPTSQGAEARRMELADVILAQLREADVSVPVTSP